MDAREGLMLVKTCSRDSRMVQCSERGRKEIV